MGERTASSFSEITFHLTAVAGPGLDNLVPNALAGYSGSIVSVLLELVLVLVLESGVAAAAGLATGAGLAGMVAVVAGPEGVKH